MSIRKRQVFSAEFKREAVALLGKGDKGGYGSIAAIFLNVRLFLTARSALGQ